MKITDELRDAAEKWTKDHRLDSGTGETEAFVAGAQWAYESGRMEERKLIEYLKSNLSALDARPGETSGEER